MKSVDICTLKFSNINRCGSNKNNNNNEAVRSSGVRVLTHFNGHIVRTILRNLRGDLSSDEINRYC